MTANETTPTLTSPSQTPAASQWLRELVGARIHYEELLGWPVTVEVAPRRLVVAVGEVLDAVTMPAPLGRAVLTELQIAMLAGPVIAGPGQAWWTFLTQPATASRPELSAALQARKIRLTPRGAHVIIPSLIDGKGLPRWIEQPRSRHVLPLWSVVIGATRRVVECGACVQSPTAPASMHGARR